MNILDINIIGVLTASLAGMILGAAWYSPAMFGNQWMRSLGKTHETLGSPTIPLIGSMIACVLTAIGVAIIFLYIGVNSVEMSVSVGLVLGFLIIFPAFLSDGLFCGWGNQLLFIQSGYRICSIVLMSAILFYLS